MSTKETEALLALASWLSPAFPTSAYAYSHGLEWATRRERGEPAGDVRDGDSFRAWVEAALMHGAARNDAILLGAAYRARAAEDFGALGDVAALSVALAGSAERRRESLDQGAAFIRTVEAAWPIRLGLGEAAHPVAVGAAAAAYGCPLEPSLALYLHAFAAMLISAAQRLVPLGQTEAQTITAALGPLIAEQARALQGASLDDLGAAAIRVDIASMRHETQEVRLFRS